MIRIYVKHDQRPPKPERKPMERYEVESELAATNVVSRALSDPTVERVELHRYWPSEESAAAAAA